MTDIDKNNPSAEWIAALKQRFVIEKEIDRVLTRKLENRSGPGYAPVALERLVEGLESLLKSELDQSFSIDRPRWLSGGASKLQMAFDLDWASPDGRRKDSMVLRMEPAESIVETSRLREFQLIRAMEGIVPVPPCYWCDADGEHLPYPALIYGFADGVTKPSNATSGVSGLGTSLPLELRQQLAPQFVEHLARIHSTSIEGRGLNAFEIPTTGTTQCAEWGINWWERVWEEDSDEDSPVMRLCASWLKSNLPLLQKPVIVHADYRLGNFLFTEQDMKISAWLDWELGRIGDHHQDLAWTTSRAFAGLAEDGKTLLTSGLLPEAEFLQSYEKASGLIVDAHSMHWHKLYNAYMIATLSLATGYRIARNGKTHQDVLVTWLIGIGPMILEEIRSLLESGPQRLG